jgi:hypothetical protein
MKSVRFCKFLILIAALGILNLFGNWVINQINLQIYPRHAETLELILLLIFISYILLMAIPFMPGIEVGLALMVMLGAKGIGLVYISTLIALSISFIVGRLIPIQLIISLLQWLHFNNAANLAQYLSEIPPTKQLAVLYEKAPPGLGHFLLHHRLISIAIVLNLPGNALIGGGGGIGMITGMSRLIPYPQFLCLIALATSPIPLFLWLKGA